MIAESLLDRFFGEAQLPPNTLILRRELFRDGNSTFLRPDVLAWCKESLAQWSARRKETMVILRVPEINSRHRSEQVMQTVMNLPVISFNDEADFLAFKLRWGC